MLIRYSIMEAVEGLRASRHQARAGDAPDLFAHPGQIRSHPEPGRVRRTSGPTSTPATPISAASTRSPGSSGSSTAWSTCTPRTSAIEQSEAERGKVMGTAVGCACGDGVIDWARVIAILRSIPQDIVLSVECGTLDQAARSIEHLRKVVG